MAAIAVNEVDVGIKKGSTWGTAADLTSAGKLMHLSNLTVTANVDEHVRRDIGFDNFRTDIDRLGHNVDVSITCDLSYHGAWLDVLASVLGTSTSSPAEENENEGDYKHEMDLTSRNAGKFSTLVWTHESDAVLEIPSIKWHTFTIESAANAVGTFSAQGIGDRVVRNSSASNTYAEVTALSYPTYQAAVLGGTNHYFRFDAYSADTALTSADDKKILNYRIVVSRPMQRRMVLNGASTPYTLEPHQLGLTTGELVFQMSEIDDSQIDGIVDWLDQTKRMAEIFFDGAQIGGGSNTSIKIQLPYIEHKGSMPTGYDVPSNNTLMQPTFSFNLLQAPAAPAGMTGVTNYIRVTSIDEYASARV